MADEKPEHLVRELFEIGTNLAENVLSELKSLRVKDPEERIYKSVLLFFFCKAYKTFKAFELLWGHGFVEDAQILCRTLFEITLQARYISQDPPLRCRLFLDHHKVKQFRTYLKKKEADLSQYPDFTTAAIQSWINSFESLPSFTDYKDFYNLNEKKFPQNKRWWGERIPWLARQCSPEMQLYYDWVYDYQSELVHTGLMASAHYLEGTDGTENVLKVSCYPIPSSNRRPVELATQMMVSVVRDIATPLDLKIAPDIKQALSRVAAIAEKD
jgi:hypothetical protein